MKRRVFLILVATMMMLYLTACGHEHVWKEASCTSAKTCETCGETEGSVLPDYFAKNNLEVNGVGNFSFSTMVLSRIIELNGNLAISEEVAGNNKTITASFEVPVFMFEDGGWG